MYRNCWSVSRTSSPGPTNNASSRTESELSDASSWSSFRSCRNASSGKTRVNGSRGTSYPGGSSSIVEVSGRTRLEKTGSCINLGQYTYRIMRGNRRSRCIEEKLNERRAFSVVAVRSEQRVLVIDCGNPHTSPASVSADATYEFVVQPDLVFGDIGVPFSVPTMRSQSEPKHLLPHSCQGNRDTLGFPTRGFCRFRSQLE